MKRRLDLTLILTVLLVLLIAGCKSNSYVQDKNPIAVEKLRPNHKYMSASVTPFNVRLDMAWSDVIILRVVPFGLAEVFRAELSADDVLLVNRLNRWYIRFDYNDIPYNGILKLNFNTIQGLLWNKVFSPGASASELKIKKSDVDGNTYKEHNAGYVFTFQDQQLISVNRSIASRTGTLNYSEFSYIDGEWFPTHYSVTMGQGKGAETDYGSVNLSNIKLSDKPSVERLDISQYRKRDLNPDDIKNLRNGDFSELIDLFR